MGYTQKQEDLLFNVSDRLYEEDNMVEMVIGVLKKDFRTFGEGLRAIMKEKLNNDIEDPIKTLKNACQKANVPITDIASKDETLTKWFGKRTKDGTWKTGSLRPKKSDDSRRRMFAFAFAMELSVEQTARLFHNVYLDRAFNCRDYKELIYYYCLDRHLSYADARALISCVSLDDTSIPADKTVWTKQLEREALQSENTNDLLQYIYEHHHNFALKTQKAKAVMLELKKQASLIVSEQYVSIREKAAGKKPKKRPKGKAGTEAEVETEEISPEYDDLLNSITYRKQITSNSNIYSVILDYKEDCKKWTTTLSFKTSDFPKEFSSNFPQIKTMNGSANTFEELRKWIVLLASYCFWEREKDICGFYDKYEAEVNNYLREANLPELYYGHPFDWLFLFCSSTDQPLENFRAILHETIIDEEKKKL